LPAAPILLQPFSADFFGARIAVAILGAATSTGRPSRSSGWRAWVW